MGQTKPNCEVRVPKFASNDCKSAEFGSKGKSGKFNWKDLSAELGLKDPKSAEFIFKNCKSDKLTNY